MSKPLRLACLALFVTVFGGLLMRAAPGCSSSEEKSAPAATPPPMGIDPTVLPATKSGAPMHLPKDPAPPSQQKPKP